MMIEFQIKNFLNHHPLSSVSAQLVRLFCELCERGWKVRLKLNLNNKINILKIFFILLRRAFASPSIKRSDILRQKGLVSSPRVLSRQYRYLRGRSVLP